MGFTSVSDADLINDISSDEEGKSENNNLVLAIKYDSDSRKLTEKGNQDSKVELLMKLSHLPEPERKRDLQNTDRRKSDCKFLARLIPI